jgi:hypothetical protein
LSQVFCEARVALRFRLLNPGPRWGSVGVRASRIELGEKGDSCPFSAVPSVPVLPKRPVHLAVTVVNTVTAYLLQQIQLLAHRDRGGLPPRSPTGNRSAKPTL